MVIFIGFAVAIAVYFFHYEGINDKVAYHFDCDELKPPNFLHIGKPEAGYIYVQAVMAESDLVLSYEHESKSIAINGFRSQYVYNVK